MKPTLDKLISNPWKCYPYFVLITVPLHIMPIIRLSQYWRQQRKIRQPAASGCNIGFIPSWPMAAQQSSLKSCCDEAMLQPQKMPLWLARNIMTRAPLWLSLIQMCLTRGFTHRHQSHGCGDQIHLYRALLGYGIDRYEPMTDFRNKDSHSRWTNPSLLMSSKCHIIIPTAKQTIKGAPRIWWWTNRASLLAKLARHGPRDLTRSHLRMPRDLTRGDLINLKSLTS